MFLWTSPGASESEVLSPRLNREVRHEQGPRPASPRGRRSRSTRRALRTVAPDEVGRHLRLEEALKILRRQRFPITLLDLQLPRQSGLEVLQALRSEGIESTVVVITAWGTLEKAVEAMRAGADDFLPKPLDLGHLDIVINQALERAALRQENRVLHSELGELERPILGQSPSFQESALGTWHSSFHSTLRPLSGTPCVLLFWRHPGDFTFEDTRNTHL
jgi:CheY-like chemotaxis protein